MEEVMSLTKGAFVIMAECKIVLNAKILDIFIFRSLSTFRLRDF